ncbi:MAG: hypothetical protein FJ119_09575 [Deltaproteobacteria bacterium]|nr:hypothetical protein [Deltaproteobacteria bacterium]
MMLRRHFIKSTAAFLASIAAAPGNTCAAIFAPGPLSSEQHRRACLVAAIEEYCSVSGIDGPNEDYVEALNSACSKIRPENHLEYAIAASCAEAEKGQELCDEYHRRKQGMEPELFTHEVLTGPGALLPDTYGLIIFKEQLERFLGGLVAEEGEVRLDAGMALRKRMGAQRLSFMDFYEGLHPRFAARLSTQQSYDLYNFLSDYHPCHSYVICLAVVARAGL